MFLCAVTPLGTIAAIKGVSELVLGIFKPERRGNEGGGGGYYSMRVCVGRWRVQVKDHRPSVIRHHTACWKYVVCVSNFRKGQGERLCTQQQQQ